MPQSIVHLIDHAVLHPTQGEAELRAACELCQRLQTASVCVKPYMVRHAAELFQGSPVKVSTVIAFPHGSTNTAVKALEAEQACRDGARELDMVVNVARVLEGDWDYVLNDIRAVVDVGRQYDSLTKVIFETGYLPSDDLKIRLCQLSEQAGAAYVKTSTGFGFVKKPDGSVAPTGATEHDVALMRKHVSNRVGIKASGGIRSYAQALRFIDLGATRLGTSATEAIAQEEQAARWGTHPTAHASQVLDY